jgi:hypothetical protein
MWDTRNGFRASVCAIEVTQPQFIPRKALHTDDTEGVAETSPGLPDSERATPGQGHQTHPFRAQRGEQSEYLCVCRANSTRDN